MGRRVFFSLVILVSDTVLVLFVSAPVFKIVLNNTFNTTLLFMCSFFSSTLYVEDGGGGVSVSGSRMNGSSSVSRAQSGRVKSEPGNFVHLL